MTIDELNALATLTAGDEIPVWDSEESGESTKKITAQNMTASVKTLGNLVNTSEMNSALVGKQNTLTFDSTPTAGSTNPVTSGGIATAIAQSTAIKTGTETLTTNANGVVALTNIKPKTHVLIALYVGNGSYGYMRTDSINSDVFGIQVLNMTSGQSPTKVVSTTLTFTYTYLDFST